MHGRILKCLTEALVRTIPDQEWSHKDLVHYLDLVRDYLLTSNLREQEELWVTLSEFLDPVGEIDTRTISLEKWRNSTPEILAECERLDGLKVCFARRLRKRMAECGLNEHQLHLQTPGLSTSAIEQFMTGLYAPASTSLEKMAVALNCEVADLWPEYD